MSEEPENLILVYLRRLDQRQERMETHLVEQGYRLTRIEGSLASLRRDQANDAEGLAHLEARIDRLRDDIDRIKRRLDIADA